MIVVFPVASWGNSTTFEAKVVKIVDGDTITALDAQNTTIKIRMYGIDAPESKQAFGQKAKRHCCKVSDEAAFCLIQRPYISKTLLTRRISPRGSP